MNWFFNLFRKQNAVTADPMKYLIVGLGNPGSDYDNTRHNVGFEVVDKLASDADTVFKNDTLGDLATIKHKGRTLILLKPTTYMNRSGKAVQHRMTKEKIQQENVLIIVDDLQLPFGTLRLREKGSDGGHNGLRDIDQVLGGNKYARLRIGIGNEFSKGRQVDYVLGKWDEKEAEGLPDILKKGAEIALSFAAIGVKFTMNQFNNK
jgi:PTH1 family peptidyl-tRNA hydrolase